MNLDYLLPVVRRVAELRDAGTADLLCSFRPSWLSAYAQLFGNVRRGIDTSRLSWATRTLHASVRSGTRPSVTDPQGGAMPGPPPELPTRSVLPWNSVMSAAAREVQTRIRLQATEPLTKARSVGLVGLAPSRELALVQLQSILGNEGLSSFVSYELVHELPWRGGGEEASEETQWFLFKVTWRAWPTQMPAGEEPRLTSLTPEGQRRRLARRAMVIMSAIVLRYGISDDVILYQLSTEFLGALERGRATSGELTGLFSFNYRRHLSKHLEWIELTRRFFDSHRSERERVLITQLPLPRTLQLNLGFFTWYAVFERERRSLEQALLVIRLGALTSKKQ